MSAPSPDYERGWADGYNAAVVQSLQLRQESLLARRCPTCHAVPGEPCWMQLDFGGAFPHRTHEKPLETPHRDRAWGVADA